MRILRVIQERIRILSYSLNEYDVAKSAIENVAHIESERKVTASLRNLRKVGLPLSKTNQQTAQNNPAHNAAQKGHSLTRRTSSTGRNTNPNPVVKITLQPTIGRIYLMVKITITHV